MSQSNQEKKPMTIAQAIITGSVAGAVEVCTTGQILWSLKTLTQNKQPLTFNPWILSRGMSLNALSMVPITSLQVGFNQLIQQAVFQGTSRSNFQKMASAFTAGVFAASIAGPTEMVMTHLKAGDKIINAPWTFVKQYGARALYTGFMGTAIRDGIFASAYLAGTPTLRSYFNEHCDNNHHANIAANVISGGLATVLSHPFDTVKSKQQLKSPTSYPSLVSEAKALYAEKGFRGFFTGGRWRGARVITAVTAIGYVTDTLEEHFSQHNAKSTP